MNRNADTLDAAVLHYLIVYRSRMRMIDLWRSVAEVQDTAGYVKFQEGILRSSLSYRLPLMIQVAVEEVLLVAIEGTNGDGGGVGCCHMGGDYRTG